MMMLYHEKKGNELRVSTEFEKERAPVVRHSFIIDAERNVTICETYASYREVTNNRLKENQDEAIILFIKQILAVQAVNQIHILRECHNKKMGGRRTIERILKLYLNTHWTRRRESLSNQWLYELIHHHTKSIAEVPSVLSILKQQAAMIKGPPTLLKMDHRLSKDCFHE
tara:strand:- start:206 stop:715 length:510 start_codon:yes stop_codon:yes gene_type:complete